MLMEKNDTSGTEILHHVTKNYHIYPNIALDTIDHIIN